MADVDAKYLHETIAVLSGMGQWIVLLTEFGGSPRVHRTPSSGVGAVRLRPEMECWRAARRQKRFRDWGETRPPAAGDAARRKYVNATKTPFVQRLIKGEKVTTLLRTRQQSPARRESRDAATL